MKKEVKLVKKLEQLLKKLNCRSYLHHFGHKKFKFVYHALALLLKESLKCSFGRVENFGCQCAKILCLVQEQKKNTDDIMEFSVETDSRGNFRCYSN